MQELDDIALLRAYAAENSERAFEILVNRHLALVYSAALRQVNDPHAAEEITQATFLILARKVGSLRPGTVLPGWLFKTVRFVAATEIRTRLRRQHYEKEAQMESTIHAGAETNSEWEQIAPLLDQAVAQLGEKDRNIVVLRFFQQKTLKEVGDVLGIETKTAQKRTERAVDKLRHYFARNGIALSGVAIIAALSTGAAQAAPPAGLAATLAASAALKGTAAASTTPLLHATLKFMAWLKLKTAIVVGVTVLLAAGGATVLVKGIDSHPAAPEPAYQGKTVTAWIQYILLAVQQRSQPRVDEGAKALTAIGAPAVPYVVRAMEHAYPPPGYGTTPERRAYENMLEITVANMDDAVALLTNSHANVRAAAANVLVMLASGEDPSFELPSAAIPLLIAMVNGDDPRCRLNASALLASFGPTARTAVPGLIKALQDISPTSGNDAAESDLMNYRNSYMHTLAEIGPDASAAVPTLKTILTDTSPGTRLDAAIALWKIGHEPADALPELLDYFSNDTNVLNSGGIYIGLSWSAIDTLGEIGPPARVAIPKLLKVISSANLSKIPLYRNTYVIHATVALWRIDGQLTNTLPILLDSVTNTGGSYDPLVLAALGEIGPPAKAVVPKLLEGLAPDAPKLDQLPQMKAVLMKIDPEALAKAFPSPSSAIKQ